MEQGILRTAEGSARLLLGKTELFVIVNGEINEIEDSEEYEKGLNFTIKVAPQGPNSLLFDPDDKEWDIEDIEREEFFQIGQASKAKSNVGELINPQGDYTLEKFAVKYEREVIEENECLVARELEKSLDKIFNKLSSLDFSKITISKNHVWSIDVEIMIVKYAGNLLEACYLGTKAALDNFSCIQPPVSHDGETGKDVIGSTQSEEGLEVWGFDVDKIPLVGASFRIGDSVLLDVNDYEAMLNPILCWVVLKRPISDRVSDDECQLLYSQLSGAGGTRMGIHREMLTFATRSARHLDILMKTYLNKWRAVEVNPYRTVLLSFSK